MSERNHSSIGIHHSPGGAGSHRVRRFEALARARRFVLYGGVAAGLGIATIATLRFMSAQALAEATQNQTVRYVELVTPKPGGGDSVLRLPATLQGYVEAPIYARTSGYVAAWYKDIGEPVKQGDLLAKIDTPEVAQQLVEAEAALKLAKASLDRWESLLQSRSVSQQEVDERRNAWASANATVQRLQYQLGFNRIVAPFNGIVTKRGVDVGNLVDSGAGAKALFVVTRSDPLRVYIQVPQTQANRIKVGDRAEVSLQELPGQDFPGRVVRTARAIDTASRTLQVEVNLPNPDGRLLPGAYVQVALQAKSGVSDGIFRIPGNALLFRPEGPQVAAVDGEGKVHLKTVKISRELGVEVELNGGVEAGDRLVINPSDSLADGDTVAVPPAAAAKGESKGKSGAG